MRHHERWPHPDHIAKDGALGIDGIPADPKHDERCSVCWPARGTMSHRVAIETRYLGPTDHRGSRIVATIDGSNKADGTPARLVVPYDDDDLDPHLLAALQLADLCSWGDTVDIYGGATKDGYTFVLLPRDGVAALERTGGR